MKPVIAINFKAYPNAFGNDAQKLLDLIEEFSKRYGIETVVALPLTEIYRSKHYDFIKIYAQTSHPIDFGAHTGRIPTKALLHYGVKGVVLNHSEDQKNIKDIEKILDDAYEHNLDVLICASSVDSSLALARYHQITYLAYEPPELISTGKSVSEYRGEDMKKISKKIKHINSKIKFLAGAGITKRKDIDLSLQLGADGVFVSSAIMKSKNIERTLEEFMAYW